MTYFNPSYFYGLYGANNVFGTDVSPSPTIGGQASLALGEPVPDTISLFDFVCSGDNCYPANVSDTLTFTIADLVPETAGFFGYPNGTTFGATLAELDPPPDFVLVSFTWAPLTWWGFESTDSTGETNVCDASGCGDYWLYPPELWFRLDPPPLENPDHPAFFMEYAGPTTAGDLSVFPLTVTDPTHGSLLHVPPGRGAGWGTQGHTAGNVGYILPPDDGGYVPDTGTWQGAADANNEATRLLWAWDGPNMLERLLVKVANADEVTQWYNTSFINGEVQEFRVTVTLFWSLTSTPTDVGEIVAGAVGRGARRRNAVAGRTVTEAA